jgi:hypothetical protein
MKIFHELVFDEFMEGTGLYRNRIHWWPVMGSIENFRLFVVADHISANANLNWTLHHSPKLDTSHLQVVKAFTAVPLTAGQKRLWQAAVDIDDAGMPASYAYILLCSLSAAVKAHVRIWATGRERY